MVKRSYKPEYVHMSAQIVSPRHDVVKEKYGIHTIENQYLEFMGGIVWNSHAD